MTDIHIEEFYRDIGLTLSKLYATFPRRVIFYVEDICGEDKPDEFGIHSERYLNGLSALTWLKDNHYIHFDALVKQEAIDQVVLTQKSFLILTSQSSAALEEDIDTSQLPPFMAQKAITNINLLRQALKSRSTITISHIVHHIMEQCHAY